MPTIRVTEPTIRPMARWLRLIVPPVVGPLERVELELPGTAHHELVVYRVTEGSPVMVQSALQLRSRADSRGYDPSPLSKASCLSSW